MAGQNTYLQGAAGQEAGARQGAQAAQQTQLGAYGTQTSGLNNAANSQGSFEVGKPSFGDSLAKGLSGALTGGATAAAGLFARGGVASKPTLARLGERGPEMVIPLGPYKKGVQHGMGR